MTTALESDIRDALTSASTSLDLSAALTRVGAANYRPRRLTLARRLSLGGVAGSATAGTVVAVVLLGGAQPAFAGWTASPTTPTGAQSSAAGESCQSSLASSPLAQQAGGGTWQPEATDVRGPFTVSSYENNGVDATCFTGPGFTVVNASSGNEHSASVSVSRSGPSDGSTGGQSAASISTLSGGDIEQLSVAHLTSSADGDYTLVDGQVSPAVTGVTLIETDGTSVVATVANGWVLAWWPSDGGVASATVTTPGGTTNQGLSELAPPAGPGSQADCGGSAGSGPTACSGSTSPNSGT
jgi:hypothetical protein